MRFDWDEHNTRHIWRHGVAPWEAEEVLTDPKRTVSAARRVDDERRWIAFGSTFAGQVLAVVFVKRGSRIRVATARPATGREKQRYRQRSG